MAPHNKRVASPQKKAVGGKRAKTVAVDITVPPALRSRLEPIFAALGGFEELPDAVRELLRHALPFCVAEVAGEERHDYQLKVLALVSDAFSQVETAKREEVETLEQKVESLKAQLESGKSQMASAEEDAKSHKAASDAQGEKTNEKEAASKAAAQAVEAAKQAVQDFIVKKGEMETGIQAFDKVLEEMWNVLLDGSFPGVHPAARWRKRDALIKELVKTLEPVSMEGSLLDAVTAALKIKTDQRGNFAKLAIDKAGEKFQDHKAKLAADFAASDATEEELKQQVGLAESALEAANAEKTKEDEEHVNLQNKWVEIDEKAFNAKREVESLEKELQAVIAEAAASKERFEAFQAVLAQAQTLGEDPPVPSPAKPAVESPEKDVAMSPAAGAVAASPPALSPAAQVVAAC